MISKRHIILILIATAILAISYSRFSVRSETPRNLTRTVIPRLENIERDSVPAFLPTTSGSNSHNSTDPRINALLNAKLPIAARVPDNIRSEMRRVHDSRDYQSLVDCLLDLNESDTVRNEVANLLSRSHYQDLPLVLFRILDNEKESSRFRAFVTQALGGLSIDIQREDVLQKLRDSLRDRHVEVRREALLALIRLRDPVGKKTAIDWLMSTAESDAEVRDVAVRGIRELNLREFIAKVRHLANDPSDIVRISAIVTLSDWSDDESRPFFLSASKSPVVRVQRAGKMALNRLDVLDRIMPQSEQTAANLVTMLSDDRTQIRNQAALALSRFTAVPESAVPAICKALLRLDETCTEKQIVIYLDLLRKFGIRAAPASESILQLMNERAVVYQNRDRREAVFLRGYMLLTICEIGKARESMLEIADALANNDSSMVYNFAIAAHVAGTLQKDGHGFEPLLLSALKSDFKDAPLSLVSYHAPLTPTTTTSARIEAIRALLKIGQRAVEAIPLLEELSKTDPNPKDNLPPWKTDACKALAVLKQLRDKEK